MMKTLLVCLVFLAAAYGAPAPPAHHDHAAYTAPALPVHHDHAAYTAPALPVHHDHAAYTAPSHPAHHDPDAYLVHEPIGHDQPNFDRYSYGYGTPEYVGSGGLIEKPVHYNIGRQGIGFDKRTAFAYGFRMPLTNNIIRILRRYPEKESHVKA